MHDVGEELHKRGIKSDTETSKAQLTLQIIQKKSCKWASSWTLKVSKKMKIPRL